MATLGWRFPLLDKGPEQGINDGGISTFKGSELYDNLAREICQNSLDAKAPGKETVIVEFNSHSFSKKQYPAVADLESIFADCRDYWSDRMEPKLSNFLDAAEAAISKDAIDVLAIRDFNTTGLKGAKATSREKSVWRALTHSNGVTEKSRGSGGSYGIGKNAPFACSVFRTVFYNSYALEDGLHAFQGVSRLITHIQNGEATQGTGFYLNTSDIEPIFEADQCSMRDFFKRNNQDYGTDVIILGFKKTVNWAEDIERAIIRNFFVAIHTGSLAVKIDGLYLDKNNLAQRINYYAEKEKRTGDKEKRITTVLEYYGAITSPDYVEKASILEENDVVLYIKKDDTYSKSIAEMRSIGMIVRTRKNHIMTRYAAVMMVQEGKLNDMLKDIEPPEHNKWDPGILENDDDKKNSDKNRKKLIAWVNDKIIECCRAELSDEMDLDGVSAYLPFDEDDPAFGHEEKLDNSPDSQVKVAEVETKQPNTRKVNLVAKKVPGHKVDDYEPGNGGGGGNNNGSGGIADPEGPDKVTAPVPGEKKVSIPKVLQQRIVQTPNPSVYRAVIKLEKDCDKVHLAVKAFNDDGTKDRIVIVGYKFEKQKYTTNSEQISLRGLKANTLYEVFLTFEYSEKMKLELYVF